MRRFRISRRGQLVSFFLLSLLAIILILPRLAFARAGGGEGYHGGGGGHGSGGGHGGGGGGGDGGGLIYLIIQLLFSHPAIGIPLLILVVVLYFYFQKKSGSLQTETLISAPTLDRSAAQSAMAALRSHDANFDESAFYQRVNLAFGKIQAAWCSQNLTVVRPFISDGVHERFTLQFSEQKAQGWRDQMDNIQVHAIALAELRSDGLFDELSVRIEASAADYRVSLAHGTRLSGSAAPERFAEIWSFLRHRGAATQPGRAGLIEGNCPNCGAPVELNQSANCTHCKALLRSGQYDWVLSEITQEVEWEGQRHEELPGVPALRSRDPEFNAVELEDRASVMFWRKATADRLGKIDPLRKSASEAFCQTYASTLRPAQNGLRQLYADCAVGSVRLLGVSADRQQSPPGQASAGDRAIVEVRWSAKRVSAAPNQPPRVLEENHLEYSLFVLWRGPGLKTDLGKGVSSAHCPTCGAPESNTASNACEFCGAVLNDGLHGWILVDLVNRTDARAAGLLAELGRS